MGKRKIKKVVGYIGDDISEKFNLEQYKGQEIIQSFDFYFHTSKHINEFETLDNYNDTITNIDKILSSTYYVYYEKDRNSLLYFSELSENVCVVVKLKLRENKDNYVATVYPLSKDKVEKFKEKELLDKYIYKELI